MGQNCHITCAALVQIGNGVSIMPQVLITDIEHGYVPGKSCTQTGLEVGSVIIGDYVAIGMGARLLGHRHLTVGENAVIGTNAVVCHDVPPGCMVAGNPAKIIRRYDGERGCWVREV